MARTRPQSALLAGLVLALVVIATAQKNADDDGFTDDNRPYKFGFNIEKFQHRLEEKNKKGIVKGEFGFVTGDGVYHETAYATDENGDFKILGMRNYFVGLPGLDLPDITKGTKANPAPQTPPPTPTTPPPAAKPFPELLGLMGCSSCIIPTTPKPGTFVGNAFNGQAGNVGASPPVSGPGPSSGFLGGSPGPAGGQQPFGQQPFGQQPFGQQPFGQQPVQEQNNNALPPQQPSFPINTAQTSTPAGGAQVSSFTAEDMLKLLYRFNYTVGFHGHNEIGDSAGKKEGGYFFNGRDGFQRNVQYTANEFGFQPNITLQELGADSKETPRAETEKGEEFGLKGYEFVWFNRRR